MTITKLLRNRLIGRLTTFQQSELRYASSRLLCASCDSKFQDSELRSRWRTFTLYAILFGSAASSWYLYNAKKNDNFSFLGNAAALTFDDPGKGDAQDPPSRRFNFIADVVERAQPCVVSIEVEKIAMTPFIGNVMTQSNGSGFFVTKDGLILTNAHVVANFSRLTVKTHKGLQFEGQVVYKDDSKDLALVKIETDKAPLLNFAKSKETRQGEFVVAMGSPFSLSNTITSGIISSNCRKGEELGLNPGLEYIQTDALINFGNSGGPLVNLDGAVVGINSMKVTAGISFAIPSDTAKAFLDEYLNLPVSRSPAWFSKSSSPIKPPIDGSEKRYIGVTMMSLNERILHELRWRNHYFPSSVTHGVYIVRVVVPSPAYKAGLRPGDVITEVNGQPVHSSSDIYAALKREGQDLDCIVVREDETFSCKISPEVPV